MPAENLYSISFVEGEPPDLRTVLVNVEVHSTLVKLWDIAMAERFDVSEVILRLQNDEFSGCHLVKVYGYQLLSAPSKIPVIEIGGEDQPSIELSACLWQY